MVAQGGGQIQCICRQAGEWWFPSQCIDAFCWFGYNSLYVRTLSSNTLKMRVDALWMLASLCVRILSSFNPKGMHVSNSFIVCMLVRALSTYCCRDKRQSRSQTWRRFVRLSLSVGIYTRLTQCWMLGSSDGYNIRFVRYSETGMILWWRYWHEIFLWSPLVPHSPTSRTFTVVAWPQHTKADAFKTKKTTSSQNQSPCTAGTNLTRDWIVWQTATTTSAICKRGCTMPTNAKEHCRFLSELTKVYRADGVVRQKHGRSTMGHRRMWQQKPHQYDRYTLQAKYYLRRIKSTSRPSKGSGLQRKWAGDAVCLLTINDVLIPTTVIPRADN